LARAFRDHRLSLAAALFDGVRDAEPASFDCESDLAQLDEWARAHFLAAVDIAGKWLASGSEQWEDLLLGWVHSRLMAPWSERGSEKRCGPSKVLECARARWLSFLESRIDEAAAQTLTEGMDRVIGGLSRPTRKGLRVLFIGDCLQYEVIAALAGPCARAQIAFAPVMIHEKVQAVLRNRIREMEANEFDLVFFSPFTHTFLAEYSELLRPESAVWRRSRFCGFLDELLEDVLSTIRALAGRLDCPIYVHNTAGTIQTFGVSVGWAKNMISWRNRRQAREIIHQRMCRYIGDPELEGRVRLLDENSVRDGRSDWTLAKVLFRGDLFHPTRLGLELGRRTCFAAIYSEAFLAGKKVVVCDLDNTLWDGVIGEGAVTHFIERQKVLKDLRNRGVLLSINSKNDPKNVHFSGGALQPDDFVAPRINWLPKVENMAAIVTELNLKVKECVFIDDRPDELERMEGAFPQIATLNAQNPETWSFLAHWAAQLPLDQEEDRTGLYRQRMAREEFLASQSQPVEAREDETAALRRLGISVKVEEAGRSGLKRVVELINRTNQFNLCGSRTTPRDLQGGVGSRHLIVTATAQDKFGSMGVVGVMKVDRQPGCVEIPIFVLSCRAFGFGIEYALLNAVKHLASADDSIIGHYRQTQYNQPCRELYPKSGLSWDGSRWIGRIGDIPTDPAWLTIERRLTAPPPATRNAQATGS
jgi:FkbH-like protein